MYFCYHCLILYLCSRSIVFMTLYKTYRVDGSKQKLEIHPFLDGSNTFSPFFSLLCHVSIFLCQKWSDYGIRRIFLFLLVLELFLCFLTFFLKLLKILTIFVFFSHFFANSELCFQRVHIVLSLKNCFFRYNILNTNCIQKTKKLSKIMTILYKIPRTHFPYLCSSFL